LRIALYIVVAFTTLATLSICFLDTFWCGLNVSQNWSLNEGACYTWSSPFNFHYQFAIDLFCDSAIIILPIPILRFLKISKWQRFGVAVTFGLGLITITVCSLRYIHTLKFDDDGTASVYIWSMAEYSASIIVVSLTSFKHIIVPRLTQLSRADLGSSFGLTPVPSVGGTKRKWIQSGSSNQGHTRDKLGSRTGSSIKPCTRDSIHESRSFNNEELTVL
jgi:hypothetical protein